MVTFVIASVPLRRLTLPGVPARRRGSPLARLAARRGGRPDHRGVRDPVGIGKSGDAGRRSADFEAFLAPLRSLPFGTAEAADAGGIRVELEAAGTPIGPLDVLIAATARANRRTLVTRDVREFERVLGLQPENGYGPESPPS